MGGNVVSFPFIVLFILCGASALFSLLSLIFVIFGGTKKVVEANTLAIKELITLIHDIDKTTSVNNKTLDDIAHHVRGTHHEH